MQNALTVDVENWYDASLLSPYVPAGYRDDRVVAATREIMDLLEEFGVRATFFVLGKVAEEHPGLVKEIAGRGHEVASHGWGHQLAYRQTEEEFEEDLHRSLEILERLSGGKVKGYRAPSWSVGVETPWFFDVLVRNGIEYDSSLFPVKTPLFGSSDNPRHFHIIERKKGRVVEFPASSVRFGGKTFPVGGGASLRLLPLAVTKWGIKRINREGMGAIVYLHPWEMDTGIPFPPMPFRTRLLHSRGRKGMKKKLRKLLESFSFHPMADCLIDN
ncbi:MAG: polysaccharide deacetylase family protein [Candidatus Erginobacter occultus]|nr:polysaccharide deacetylase family protein [Candidatus Erginobacter occultus]